MAWTINYDSNNGIVFIAYHGTITKQDILEATEKAFTLTETYDCHLFLTELKNISSELNIVDIFRIPDLWGELGFKRTNKAAVIISKDDKLYEDVKLHVITSRNQGWMVGMFEDKEYAINWLIGTS